MKLKDIRMEKGLTQEQAAQTLGISRRTYIKYENDETREKDLKYKFMCQTLASYGVIDEEHGILTIEQIREVCAEVFEEYDVEYGYLFGSYAKGKAKENSDVDLLVSFPINGLKFFGFIETLRQKLKKRVEVLDLGQLNNNMELVKEILRDGIRIYG